MPISRPLTFLFLLFGFLGYENLKHDKKADTQKRKNKTQREEQAYVGVASHRCWKPILNKFTSTAGRKIVSRHPTQKLEISNSHEMGPQGTDLSLDPWIRYGFSRRIRFWPSRGPGRPEKSQKSPRKFSQHFGNFLPPPLVALMKCNVLISIYLSIERERYIYIY